MKMIAGWAVLALAACGGGEAQDTSEPDMSNVEEVAVIGDDLAPFGDGYPNAGDPCRRLGESEKTANWLDDSATLVGCPTEASAEALGGEIVDNVGGVRIVSVPMSTDQRAAAQAEFVESEDVLVPGTDYSATTIMDCGFGGKPPTQSCNAGIKRNWGEKGEALIEVMKPDGRKRAIFVKGLEPYGADSAQADGSAGWDFKTSREGDRVTVKFGPETYVIVDAMIEGG
ncbi:hypothetical protein [Sphingomicrobium nitratireducens]|uniref:hypothetical protein n=1 Tax=Sphingomicrobium nitratireducens TaxID=2964666 RepID=UPI00223E922C|nr:hypothetical protein [Sphingomicrobium nitratireducens]